MSSAYAAVLLAVAAFAAAKGGTAEDAQRMQEHLSSTNPGLPTTAWMAHDQLQQAWEATR